MPRDAARDAARAQAKRAKLEYDDRGSLSGDNNAHGEQLQKQQNEVAAQ